MINKILFITTILFSTTVWSHSGSDPAHDLKKNSKRLAEVQNSYIKIESNDERIDSLNSQIHYLQKNILIMRTLLTKESTNQEQCFKNNKIDYLQTMESNLKLFMQTVEQSEEVIK